MQRAVLPQGSSRLQQLPPELQIAIFSNLVSSSGHSSILSVLLTCKSLYRVALPLSVRIFRNTPRTQGRGFCSERRNAQFLRYILISKPELVKFVDTIILGAFSPWPDADLIDEDDQEEEEGGGGEGGWRVFDEYGTEELLIYEKRIHDTINPDAIAGFAEVWISDLGSGRSDAQAALILTCCPNLRNLYFEVPRMQRHFLRVLQLANRSDSLLRPGLRPPLSRLQYIYTESDDHIDLVDSNDRHPGPYFELDSLRSFEGFEINSTNRVVGFFQQLPARSSNVEEITLRRSCISPQMLQSLLGACRAVKKLEIIREISPGSAEELLPGHVMAAILPHADSLEYLHHNAAEEFQLHIMTQGEHLLMGLELRKMRALKTLVTGMRSVTGFFNGYTVFGDTNVPARIPRVEGAPSLVDCLPENLECLEIHRCGESILDEAKSLVLAVQEGRALTKLKRLRLLFDREDVDPVKVHQAFEGATMNIDLVFQSLQHRLYDLIPQYRKNGIRIKGISSPMYAKNLRERWLATRGQDIGSASTDLEVYDMPGGEVSPESP